MKNIFINYRNRGIGLAETIYNSLLNYLIKDDSGYSEVKPFYPYLAPIDNSYHDSIQSNIDEALSTAKVFIIILTDGYFDNCIKDGSINQRDVVYHELKKALEKAKRKELSFLCVQKSDKSIFDYDNLLSSLFTEEEKNILCNIYPIKASDDVYGRNTVITTLEKQLEELLCEKYDNNYSFTDFIAMFYKIYGPQNIERDFYMTYARLIEAIAACMQSINSGKYNKIACELPTVFSWFCSMITKCNININELENYIWRKFPEKCPYCKAGPCQCHSNRSYKKELNILEHNVSTNKNKSLNDWQKMFNDIYPRPTASIAITTEGNRNFNHLIEELGEISESFRLSYYNEENLYYEIADAFSWILGISNWLNNVANDPDTPIVVSPTLTLRGYKLSTEVLRKYNKKCTRCKKCPCKCSIDLDSVHKISDNINEKVN